MKPSQPFMFRDTLNTLTMDMGEDFPKAFNEDTGGHDWFMFPHSGRNAGGKLERKVTCGWVMVTATAYYYEGMTYKDLQNNRFTRYSWRTGLTGAGGLWSYALFPGREATLSETGKLFGPKTRLPEDLKKGPKFKKLETIPKGDVVTRKFFVSWDRTGKTFILQDHQADMVMALMTGL
jgi:hypothetical protein